MNNSKSLLLTLLSTIALQWNAIHAEQLTLTEAGSLAGTVGANVSMTQLSITGPLDAADFQFINDEMTSLVKLDLSRASIAAYSGEPLKIGRTDYPANALPAYALAGTKLVEIKLPMSLTAIGEGALASSQIESISLPSGLTGIGGGAFSGCLKLKNIIVPSSVTEMGERVFANCQSLVSAEFQRSEIPAYTFEMCTSLKKVTAPAGGFSTIGANAFRGCSSLSEMTFGSSLRSIGNAAFELSGLESADMSGCPRLEYIGERVFSRCINLKDVKLPECLKSIGEAAFFDDTALASVNFPASCKELTPYVFKGNTSVDTTSLVHSNVTSIGDYSLMGLNHVTTFTLPNALEHIGSHAMEGWNSLLQLNATGIAKVPSTGDDVWANVTQSQVDLLVGQGMVEKFEAAPQWQDFHILFQSGINEINADNGTGNHGVKARFSGRDLIITAPEDIENVSLYDASGMELLNMAPASETAVIDTSDRTARIYIVTVKLATGPTVTFKLAR